jgi:methylated-DNA-protein-cysteine methyltransferase related protein
MRRKADDPGEKRRSPAADRMQRIWATVCDIPRGSVASYGQVAELAGLPRGARQVGYALRHLPGDREVPWHRVLTASGRPAFEPGSRSWRRQVNRLAEEDVPLLKDKVDMKKYRWQPDLDELLWKPSAAWDEP